MKNCIKQASETTAEIDDRGGQSTGTTRR